MLSTADMGFERAGKVGDMSVYDVMLRSKDGDRTLSSRMYDYLCNPKQA